MTIRTGHFIVCALVSAIALAAFGCAQQGAPQGGPPDTTPPAVDSTSPGSGDVLVPRTTALTIQFSEPMDRTTFEAGLEISPSRTGSPEFEWSNGSRRVEITWPDSLRDSTSYRITLNNRIADRRGNKLPEPMTFAFSTGPQVDRGEIRGYIHASSEKSGAFDVFAYRAESLTDTFWLSIPDYVTQSGPGGHFQLPFLRAGTYRILVLTDANRNQRLNHGEQFALSTRDFPVADDLPPDSSDWFPVVFDTTAFELRNCSSTIPGVVSLAFSHPIDTATSSVWRIEAHDSATGLPATFSILNPTLRRPSLISLVGGWTTAAVYEVAVSNLIDQRGIELPGDTCYLKYDPRPDSQPPKIESVTLPTPEVGMTTKDPIIWVFSEPMDTARVGGALSVRDTLGSEVGGQSRWIDPQTFAFFPDQPWVDTVIVVAAIDSTRISDAAGNVALTGTYSWRFTPLTDTRMGSAEITIETTSSVAAEIWIEARSIADLRKAKLMVSGPGVISMPLPAGRWQLSGFVDSNRDGRWFPGGINPFAFSEMRVIHSDTLDVRARFTLEDISLKF